MTPEPERTHDAAPTVLQVIGSVAASFFGVQNARNRHRDFEHGNPLAFIAVGFGMTALVVLTFLTAAQIALHVAGR